MSTEQTTHDRIAFLRGLRSVRAFRPDPVPQQVIADILDVARWSGSAKNLQPWDFVVVHDRATLETLGALEGYVTHLAGATFVIVIVLANEGERTEQETFDDGKVSERMMLAAAAHGVGSCIGWFHGTGRDEAKRILGVPSDHVLRTAISFGYPDEAALRARPKPPEARKSLSKLVHLERYG
ncbi:MAG: nitroreductase family protein [Thermomicrobiales bacterium]